MSRFDALLMAIAEIKKAHLGTAKQLTTYCDIYPSQTSTWFWSSTRGPVPNAEVSLRAFQWVCVLKGATDLFLLPDWSTLQFELFLRFYGEQHALDAIHLRHGTDIDLIKSGPEKGQRRYPPGGEPLPNPSVLKKLARDLDVSEADLSSHVPYPWQDASPPDGEFVLNLLAFHHSTRQRREAFHFFICNELEGIADRGAIPCGIPGGITPFQCDLIVTAKRLTPIYRAPTFPLPDWLARIIL